jgi:hypothetical protein
MKIIVRVDLIPDWDDISTIEVGHKLIDQAKNSNQKPWGC